MRYTNSYYVTLHYCTHRRLQHGGSDAYTALRQSTLVYSSQSTAGEVDDFQGQPRSQVTAPLCIVACRKDVGCYENVRSLNGTNLINAFISIYGSVEYGQ